MIKLWDIKLVNINKNKFKDLKITFHIKREDYTTDIENKLFELCENASILAIWIQETDFTEDTWKTDREIKNKLLQDLAFYMQKYAEKEICNIEDLKKDIYKRYWIESRSELNIKDLKKEVESYKAW